MLFWIFVRMLIIGVGCIVIYHKTRVGEWVDLVGWLLNVVATLAIVISFIAMVSNHFCTDATVASMNERYDSLVWQYENDIYDNDNDFGKRELMLDIQEWNEGLARKQNLQDNFWVGIYYPDIYDQFDFVEYRGDTE
jgi:hypothetical protein